MAIADDIYLFDSGSLARSLIGVACSEAIPWQISYAQLRQNALNLFESSPKVRQLMDRYGAWDSRSLLADISTDLSTDPSDLSVWLSTIVFDAVQLVPDISPVTHLGHSVPLHVFWHPLSAILCDGRFPKLQRIATDVDLRAMLVAFRPPSTASAFGWVPFDELVVWATTGRLDVYGSLWPGLMPIVERAIAHDVGLCVIRSG